MQSFKDLYKKVDKQKILEFAKKNRYLILTLVLFSLVFYWTQVRPGEIYAACHDLAEEFAATEYKEKRPYAEEGRYLTADYERWYKQCLRSKGFDK